ncbi:MAG: DUF805 domain-containing protein, partial [Thermoguttaceae bacterium]|nr:DUF805 domain-containing protein [Thermoguttaceae bacterium]
DINWNGFWLWLWPVPVAQIFLWVVLFLRKGTDGPNRYNDARPPRPLCRNPVCWGVAVLVCWMCVPLLLAKFPARITPETHFITEPRKPNGQVDYYTPLLEQYAEMFKDPEQNGMRDLLQMFGPPVLIYTNDTESPDYQIVSLTYEKLNLPLDTKPEFPDYIFTFDDWMREHLPKVDDTYMDVSSLKTSPEDYMRTEFDEPESLSDPKMGEYVLSFYVDFHLTQPWKDEDHPLAAEWLKENDPILDRVAEAVRKPYLMPYHFTAENTILFTEWPLRIHSFVKSYQIRAAHSLEIGEEEKALEDVRTILLIGQHLQKSPYRIYVFNGEVSESDACQTLQLALKSGKLSLQGLEKAAALLDEVLKFQSQQPTWREISEKLKYEDFAVLQSQISDWRSAQELYFGEWNEKDFLEEKTIRKTFHKILTGFMEKEDDAETFIPLEAHDRFLKELEKECTSPWKEPWRLLTGTFFRSWVSRKLAWNFAESFDVYWFRFFYFQNRMMVNQLRIAAELERYKLQNGAYPETLAELGLPQDVLTDSFSPTKEPLKYRLNPESEEAFWKRYETWKEDLPDYIVKRSGNEDDEEFSEPVRLQWRPYLLYSVGPDQKDDGGKNTWFNRRFGDRVF